jgi:hypothetical protein
MGVPDRPETAVPPTKYVIGDTRYMKIQNLGRAVGIWNTPANKTIMENMMVARRAAVVASGNGATTINAKVPARM